MEDVLLRRITSGSGAFARRGDRVGVPLPLPEGFDGTCSSSGETATPAALENGEEASRETGEESPPSALLAPGLLLLLYPLTIRTPVVLLAGDELWWRGRLLQLRPLLGPLTTRTPVLLLFAARGTCASFPSAAPGGYARTPCLPDST